MKKTVDRQDSGPSSDSQDVAFKPLSRRAARTIEEAVKIAMMRAGPNRDLPTEVHNEVRDMLAHQVMIFLKNKPDQNSQELIHNFFHKIVGE